MSSFRGFRALWPSLLGLSLSLNSACGPGTKPEPQSVRAKPRAEVSAASLQRAIQLLDTSRYREAEAILQPGFKGDAALQAESLAAEATVQWARLLLITGRYDQAADALSQLLVRQPSGVAKPLQQQARVILVEALERRGKRAQALAASTEAARQPGAWAAKRQLGEVLLRRGRRGEAESVLQQVIEAYNDDRIADSDAQAMAEVGRVAYLLRSPQDANDAFNLAEQASTVSAEQLLLWRAEMLLERHDPDQAAEVLSELLARAPDHPLALARLAQAQLAQTLDFQAAEALANRALQGNPALSEAHFVLAGVRLRDMELAAAEAQLRRGLSHDAGDLELLSLRATVRFLAGDSQGFAAVERQVLTLNSQYARLYAIVAEYADWEHRYPEVVGLLQRAVRVDDAEPAAHAGLGINLIRLGDESGGRAALRRAFALDPFDVRVFNTLNLYEQVIDKEYESEDQGPFRFRYPKAERDILARHVPKLMTEAWQHMIAAYGLTPEQPLGVEMYSAREHFAVRTSGLPNTGISGVCFGKTLAVITPREEALNLGMTLWHELAHVFHIQLSKSRVPRWFTEGLAEYETLVRRPEWSREHDIDLYRAWQQGRLPKVAQMNRAFSHAESMQDMAVAYYASSQLVTLLAEHFGREKLRRMLQLWGEGKSDETVFQQGLGMASERLDQLFAEYLVRRLQRYKGQFVAEANSGSSVKWRERLQRTPGDTSLQLKLARSLFEERQLERAEQVLREVLQRDPAEAQARFLKGRLEEARDPKACVATVQNLLADGHKGYDSYLLHARCLHAAGEDPAASLRDAHRLDPTQAQPLFGLWQVVRGVDEAEEVEVLRNLARLEQHEGRVYHRLLELLLKRGAIEEAVQVGQSAIWVDLENAETHELYAKALRAAGQQQAAQWALESARVAR